MTFRFIHSSDLHIGRKFANIPQDADGNIRGRLMEARHNAIEKLAAAARDNGAGHVLLAGDTFDTPTPSPSLVRQALAAMGDASDVTWWIIPGNHDNLRGAEPLWDMIASDGPANVRAVTEAAPIEVEPNVYLLPCPVQYRASGTDRTEALVRMETPNGALRIGLAHGGITDFTESGEVIAADRDRTARLDYLALGDWHGRIAVSPRVHYCGSPEQDRYKHGRRGLCLLVSVDAGREPDVTEIETGHFLWQELPLDLVSGQNPAEELERLLPATGRRNVLLRVRATGWAGLADQAELERAVMKVGPEFACFDLRAEALRARYDPTDLDEIDSRGGALRITAEALMTEAGDDALSEDDRSIAAEALARLYSYVKEDAQ